MIKWSPSSFVTATFAMNPYTMGIVAHFCLSRTNFLPMLAGGTPDLSQKFAPPPEYRDAFAAAYKIIKSEGRFITPVDGGLGEVNLRDIDAKPYILRDDNDYKEWDKYLLDRTNEFEEIHEMLSAAGVSETDIRTISLTDVMEFTAHQQESLARVINDKVRVGLDY